MENLTDKEIEFLRGLRELTLKTGIKIAGCGCCDSPWLEKLEDKDLDLDNGYAVHVNMVSWISKSAEYYWENYSNKIVK